MEKRLMQSMLYAVCIALWVAPVAALIGAFAGAAPIGFMTIALFGGPAALIAACMHRKLRVIVLIIGVVSYTLAVCFLSKLNLIPLIIVCAFGVLFALILARRLLMPQVTWYDMSQMIAGLVVLAVMFCVNFVVKNLEVAAVINVCAPIYAAYILFSSNKISLRTGYMDAPVQPGVLNRNRVLVAIYTVVGCGALYFDELRKLTLAAYLWVMGIVGAAITFLSSLFAETPIDASSGVGSGAQPMMPIDAQAQPALIWVILEWIMQRAMVIILIFGGGFIIYKVGCGVFKRILKLLNSVKRYSRDLSGDWVEESVDLKADTDLRSRISGKVASVVIGMMRRENFGSMDNRQRVRYCARQVYARAWKRGQDTDSRTFREIQAGEIADIYDRARYSSDEISRDDAQRMRDGVNNA